MSNEEIINAYIDEHKKFISVHDTLGWKQFVSPLKDRHNDYLEIFIKEEKTGFIISDDGYITNELATCGMKHNFNLDKSFVEDFELTNDAINKHISKEELGFYMNRLLFTMLGISNVIELHGRFIEE